MNVVQVVPRYPPRTGGVETHVKEVSERLVERDHDVTVLTADDDQDVSSRERKNGVEVIRHHGLAPSGSFHFAPGILRTLRRFDADVVHAHNYHALPMLFAALGARDARFIVTPHYHGGSASPFRDSLLSVYRPLGCWALNRANEVVAVSEWERDQLRSDFGIDAAVIPNGINVDRFRNAEPEQREQPYLLTVGRLEEYKGVQHVIHSLSKLPDFDLLVAGSGPFRSELERTAAEEGVENRVTFLGYVADEELPSLYAGASVYVSLSSFEAYGMTVAEAVAAGTPVVVRKRGALRNWATEDGCVGITDTTPTEVARSVEEAASREVDDESLPSWDNVVDAIENKYGECRD